MTLRILHIDEQTGWRGGEQQVSYLANGQASRGHQVFLAGRPFSEFVTREHVPDSVTIFELPMRNELDFFSIRKLAMVIRQNNIDIIHAHTSHAHTLACLARKWAGVGKVIVSRRVDFPPKSDPLNRLKYAMPDRYVAISKAIRAVLIERRIPEKKIRLVHSAIDPERVHAEPISRSELGVPDDAILVGNVAALVGHKDQATLIQAIAQLPDNIHLLIAGEGVLRPELERLIAELNLSNRVHLLGYRNDVPAILNALDLFVMSSKEEGLGTSILDAMACNVPVVATAAGGIPEMVVDGETGLLAPPQQPKSLADAIARMLSDESLEAKVVAGADEKLRNEFSVDAMVEGNLRVYDELLGHL